MPRSVFRFEGLAPPGGRQVVPDTVEGFTFVGFQAVDRAAPVGGDGVENVVDAGSGQAAGVNLAPISAFLLNEDGFDLRSGIFAAVRAETLTFTVTGFRAGEVVAERVVTLDQDAERLFFGRDFRDLDAVTFTPSGGGGTLFDPLADNFFAVDNLAVRSDVQPIG